MNRPTNVVPSTHSPVPQVLSALYWLVLSLLVVVPLIFVTSVHHIYAAPKFAVLVTASPILLILLLIALCSSPASLRLMWSRHTRIVFVYFAVISVSTAFGVAPVSSFFGSPYNRMGLITHLCFLICFLAVVVGVGESRRRLTNVVWAMVLAGLLVSVYSVAQFFGRDPFLSQRAYTFQSASESIVRVIGTLGHSNYLGGFLLYSALMGAGLALSAPGRTRRVASISAALAMAAIVFSGTRGAWLGLITGVFSLVVLEAWARIRTLIHTSRVRLIRLAAVAFAVVLGSILLIGASPASRSILVRARSFVAEGFTGAGRTLLWRDSIRMAPSYALTGCGPEGFRQAFLPFKSEGLARLAPDINNESSHNSYLDAAISYGLPGVILYVAIIASSLKLLLDARRRSSSPGLRAIIAGILSTLVAVAVHNIFIFDQIPTGFYFLVVVALAQSARLVTLSAGGDADPDRSERMIDPVKGEAHGLRRSRSGWAGGVAIGIAGLLAIAGIWYSVGIVRAETAVNRAFGRANNSDLDGVVAEGSIAASVFDPVGDYDFLVARALVLCGDRLTQSRGDRPARERLQAADLARSYAEASLKRTMTPDSVHLLLSYIALVEGDEPALRAHAAEAIRWDANYSSGHWLMAEAHLVQGERKEAVREARIALLLDPSSAAARSALKRARGEPAGRRRTVQETVEWGRQLASENKMRKARRVFKAAIRRSDGSCPDCHGALASVYEAMGQDDDAIREWQITMQQARESTAAEAAKHHIESLRQKGR